MSKRLVAPRILLAVVSLSLAAPAAAIPALARKYATSCLTCHSVYPKLTPFGEAFRANGYRFPGVDSDKIKTAMVALGQEANKKTFPATVWPDSIPAAVPLSVGANGQAFVIPSKTSTQGQASHGAKFTMQDINSEAHLWFAGALDDTITVWGEVTLADGGADVEHAQLLFNDLVGPDHAVNVIVGHGFPNVTQYGPHSSYLGDQMLPVVPVTAIYQGNPEPFTLVDNYTGVEVNGVLAGRFGYALGLNAGKLNDQFATDNFYGRIGFKVGGLRLDGEEATGLEDAMRPWAETAVGAYAFGYQSNSRYDLGAGQQNDVANVVGVGARGQYGSTELDVGFYDERHNHGTDALGKVTAQVWFGELSYVLYPWLVPVLRVEGATLKPAGGPSARDVHVVPGVAFLIRPNVKLVAVGNWESASGFPTTGAGPQPWQGGASAWGPMQIGPPASGASKSSEFESIGLFLAFAL